MCVLKAEEILQEGGQEDRLNREMYHHYRETGFREPVRHLSNNMRPPPFPLDATTEDIATSLSLTFMRRGVTHVGLMQEIQFGNRRSGFKSQLCHSPGVDQGLPEVISSRGGGGKTRSKGS